MSANSDPPPPPPRKSGLEAAHRHPRSLVRCSRGPGEPGPASRSDTGTEPGTRSGRRRAGPQGGPGLPLLGTGFPRPGRRALRLLSQGKSAGVGSGGASGAESSLLSVLPAVPSAALYTVRRRAFRPGKGPGARARGETRPSPRALPAPLGSRAGPGRRAGEGGDGCCPRAPSPRPEPARPSAGALTGTGRPRAAGSRGPTASALHADVLCACAASGAPARCLRAEAAGRWRPPGPPGLRGGASAPRATPGEASAGGGGGGGDSWLHPGPQASPPASGSSEGQDCLSALPPVRERREGARGRPRPGVRPHPRGFGPGFRSGRRGRLARR